MPCHWCGRPHAGYSCPRDGETSEDAQRRERQTEQDEAAYRERESNGIRTPKWWMPTGSGPNHRR